MIIPTIPADELEILKKRKDKWTDEMQGFMVKYMDIITVSDLRDQINAIFNIDYSTEAIRNRIKRHREKNV